MDEATGAVYVLWQKWTGMDARVRLAGYLDGTWLGPRTFAGGDGTAASNPVMLIHRAVTEIVEGTDADGQPIVAEFASSFLHLAWWSQFSDDDPGLAVYAGVELHTNGTPLFGEMEPVELNDVLPYGFACFEVEAGDNVRHPKLFIDPQSGNPHVFATDLSNCLFQIYELIPQIEEAAAASRFSCIGIPRSKMPSTTSNWISRASPMPRSWCSTKVSATSRRTS
ncbi:MAG: hypothetical protein IFK92_07365 [Acidobacteria bacterium]|nr:hypothetical protein [Candidatus Sulfomarinibacter kjeldsenii]